MIKPTIHNNGTGSETLVEGYLEASRAVCTAQEALKKIEFNARDYYPQGMEVWDEAVREMRNRLVTLEKMAEELLEIAGHCQEQRRKR